MTYDPRSLRAGEASFKFYYRDGVGMLEQLLCEPELKGEGPEDDSKIQLRAFKLEGTFPDGSKTRVYSSPMSCDLANAAQELLEDLAEAGEFGTPWLGFEPQVSAVL